MCHYGRQEAAVFLLGLLLTCGGRLGETHQDRRGVERDRREAVCRPALRRVEAGQEFEHDPPLSGHGDQGSDLPVYGLDPGGVRVAGPGQVVFPEDAEQVQGRTAKRTVRRRVPLVSLGPGDVARRALFSRQNDPPIPDHLQAFLDSLAVCEHCRLNSGRTQRVVSVRPEREGSPVTAPSTIRRRVVGRGATRNAMPSEPTAVHSALRVVSVFSAPTGRPKEARGNSWEKSISRFFRNPVRAAPRSRRNPQGYGRNTAALSWLKNKIMSISRGVAPLLLGTPRWG